MSSGFLGFNIATNGLFTARTALDVTAHNISNANTKGYSRQIVEQRATRPLPNAGKGMLGTGSEVYGINQMRDFYIDTKYWSESAILGQYSVKKTQLSLIESLFNEPSDSGFNTIFNSFFDAVNGVVNNADSGEHRAALKEAAVTLTQYFNTTAQHLKKYQRDLNFEIKTKVEEINVIARKIQSLNQQIYKYELDGSKANDLRDERAKLVDQLSKIVNVEVDEIETNPEVRNGNLSGVDNRDKSEKHFRVKINGQILVDHFYATELKLVPRENADGDDVKYNPEDVEGLYDIKWANGLNFDITDPNLGGELKGYLDMRDGNNNQNFKGKFDLAVNNGDGTVTLTISNPSRIDIDAKGIITVNGRSIDYTDFQYDSVANTITLNVQEGQWNSISTPISDVEIGNGMAYKGIPYYLNRLNEFVRTFARAVNEGQDRNGAPIAELGGGHFNAINSEGETGLYFFTYKENSTAKGTNELGGPLDYTKITADNFSLSKDILEDVGKIAAALNGESLPSGNGFMEGLKALRNYTHLFREGTADSYMNSIISELGINAKQANMLEATQTNITMAVENQRMSVSGVDINEEMTNMIQFQQMYNAAAKMISVMDQILDVTINRMGV
ncbi:flagellar hook-associated protein FlgK [Defluviitalea saccharophila]|uniref:Flagellar hook-associated protein 1 n=1 Tax=Defluviitalea saccharophila TaxID=879970 RepID=A0ABZ2Y0C6_9FIRM